MAEPVSDDRIAITLGGSLQEEGNLDGTAESITVFTGSVEIRAADEVLLPDVANSIRFLADAPHSYRNMGGGEAQQSMLLTIPGERDRIVFQRKKMWGSSNLEIPHIFLVPIERFQAIRRPSCR